MINTDLVGRCVMVSNDPGYKIKSIKAIIRAVVPRGDMGDINLIVELMIFDKGKLWSRAIGEVEMVDEVEEARIERAKLEEALDKAEGL